MPEDWMSERLLRAFGDEIIRITRRRASAHEGSVLETSAFRILWALVEGRASTLRTLAEELQLEQSTINRQVNAAIKHGLVESVPVEGQASRLLRPTPEGVEAYRHDGRLRADLLRIALESLGEQRGTTLVEELRALNDAMDRARERLSGD